MSIAPMLQNSELKKLERAIFVRLDKMDQNLSDIKSLLLGLVPQQSDSVDDFMLNPCQSTRELHDLCIKLKDQEYKKKVVS